MIRLNNLIILLFVIILLTNGTAVFCGDLLIFGNNDKSPKYYLENKKPKGILIDIMRYAEAETGYSFDIILYPWKRAYHNALQEKGGIIGLSKNSERLRIFDYSDVMYYDDLVLVVLKGNEFPFDKIEDLKGKTLGVQRGSSYGEEFEKGKGVLFETVEDDNQVNRLRRLLRNRLDAALIGPGKIGFSHIVRQDSELLRRKDEFVILPKLFKRDPNFLGFLKTMEMRTFLEKFNRALEKGRKTGAVQKILDSYSN